MLSRTVRTRGLPWLQRRTLIVGTPIIPMLRIVRCLWFYASTSPASSPRAHRTFAGQEARWPMPLIPSHIECTGPTFTPDRDVFSTCWCCSATEAFSYPLSLSDATTFHPITTPTIQPGREPIRLQPYNNTRPAWESHSMSIGHLR
jgi:hypothetical protein